MREHVLGERFCCRHHDDCRASATATRPGVSFYAGQLSYVGRHYDTEVDGGPFRVLVVPMETGRAREHVTIAQRELSDRLRRRCLIDNKLLELTPQRVHHRPVRLLPRRGRVDHLPNKHSPFRLRRSAET